MTQVLHICAFLLIGLITPLASLAISRPVSGQVTLVIAAPWDDAHAIARRAGGKVIGLAGVTFAGLAQSDNPEFAAQLRTNGAWVVSDGRLMAKYCGSPV